MSDKQNSNSNVNSNGDGTITVHVFGRTDVGLVREHNEDNFLVADLTRGNRSIKPEVRSHTVGDKGSLFVVCDGMGGAAAGEVASRIAVDTIYEEMQSGEVSSSDQELAEKLDSAISEAGLRIHTAARLDRGRRGMGTTVTAAVLNSPRLLLGQVGDSRAHIVRSGQLVQVTKDQSLVQQLIDAKQLTDDEAKNFERSNIILQALGTAEEVHVDVTEVDLCKGDILVMCSDGLSGMVEPEAIREIVVSTDDLVEACRLLTDAACQGGGDDNITVLVARFEGDLPAPPAEQALEYKKFPGMAKVSDEPPKPKPVLNDNDLEEDRLPETEREMPVPSTDASEKEKPARVEKKAEAEPAKEDSEARVERSQAGKASGKLIAAFVAVAVIAVVLFFWIAFGGNKDNGTPVANDVPVPVENGLVAPAPQAPAPAPIPTPAPIPAPAPTPDPQEPEVQPQDADSFAPSLTLPDIPEEPVSEEPAPKKAAQRKAKKRSKPAAKAPKKVKGKKVLDDNPF